MRVLLDTHIALWALAASEKLPEKAERIISDDTNEIFYSLVSIWEIAIKHLVHPDKIPLSEAEFLNYCKLTDYRQLPITENHILTVRTLHRPENAPKHNDPFDRLLLAQAKAQGMLFLTHDALIPYYNEPCVFSV